VVVVPASAGPAGFGAAAVKPTRRRRYCKAKQTTPVMTRIVIHKPRDLRWATDRPIDDDLLNEGGWPPGRAGHRPPGRSRRRSAGRSPGRSAGLIRPSVPGCLLMRPCPATPNPSCAGGYLERAHMVTLPFLRTCERAGSTALLSDRWVFIGRDDLGAGGPPPTFAANQRRQPRRFSWTVVLASAVSTHEAGGATGC